jgi:hypothetical protein
MIVDDEYAPTHSGDDRRDRGAEQSGKPHGAASILPVGELP